MRPLIIVVDSPGSPDPEQDSPREFSSKSLFPKKAAVAIEPLKGWTVSVVTFGKDPEAAAKNMYSELLSNGIMGVSVVPGRDDLDELDNFLAANWESLAHRQKERPGPSETELLCLTRDPRVRFSNRLGLARCDAMAV